MGFVGRKPTNAPLVSSDLGTGIVGSTNIADNAVLTDNIADNAVLTGKIADGTITLDDLSATGTKDATTFLRGDNTFASAGGGIVLQVVTATDSTSRTISSPSTFTLGGSTLTLSITPSSASNKIFINFTSCCTPTTGVDAQLTIFRDSTNIGNTSGFTKFTNDGGYVQQPVAISVLDSPSTTSAIIYQVRCTGNSLTLNTNSTKGTITAFEIQG
jgi:hypothetical protein